MLENSDVATSGFGIQTNPKLSHVMKHRDWVASPLLYASRSLNLHSRENKVAAKLLKMERTEDLST